MMQPADIPTPAQYPEPSTVPPPPAEDRAELGILFVHGMGDQQRGDTVTEMGGALYEWLHTHLRDAPLQPTIRHASLRSAHPEIGDGASIVITFDPPSDDETAAGTRTGTSPQAPAAKLSDSPRWILRESWWADAFAPASFLETAVWAFGAGPWMIASQLGAISRRVSIKEELGAFGVAVPLIRGVTTLVLTLVAALVAALITPLVVALFILSLIPIPLLQGVARGAQRNLAGSFGDLSVLVNSPVRFAAMWSRVQDDIINLRRTCRTVVVVAHSQGSAVSWQAIRRIAQAMPDERDGAEARGEDALAQIRLLVTFGQALRKLKALYLLHTRGTFRDKIGLIVLSVASTLALITMAVTGLYLTGQFVFGSRGELSSLTGSELPWFAAAFGAALLVVIVLQWRLGALARAWDETAETSLVGEIEAVHDQIPTFEWLDLWASADPAPNGPLLVAPGPVAPYVSSYKIRNLGSTALDHSVYWHNMTEFVGAVAYAIAGRLRSPAMAVDTPMPRTLSRGALRRHSRVDLIVTARLTYLVATVAILHEFRRSFPAVGESILRFVASLPGPPEELNWDGWANGVVGALPFVIGAFVGWYLVSKTWEAVVRLDAGLAERRERQYFTVPVVAWLLAHVAITIVFLLWLWGANPAAALVCVVLVVFALPITLLVLGAGGRRLGDPEPTIPWNAMGIRSWLAVAALAVAGLLALNTGLEVQFAGIVLGLFGATLLAAGILAARRFRTDWTADVDPGTGQRVYEQQDAQPRAVPGTGG
jgi:hypothetical protein